MTPISTIRTYVDLTRPQNASGSVLTYGIGFFLAVSEKLSFDFFVGLTVMLALHSMATVQNDIEDYGIDRANNRQSLLQSKILSIKTAKLFMLGLAVFALAVALISQHRELHLLAIACLAAIAWLYNSSPVRASRRPVLSIFVMGICFGVLPFVYGYFVAQGKVTANYFFAFVAFCFLSRVGTAIMKDYKDAAGDRLFNKRTFYLHFGRKLTGWTSIVSSSIAYLGLVFVVLATRTKSVMLIVTLALAALLALRNIYKRLGLVKTDNEKRLNIIFHEGVFMHNQFEAAILLCLILS
jgi:4-hydroxybenzoate polyprenyltransferase